ncbi:hypothetical protein [Nonlabens xiamenensis]|uniref:hypothetical protein n=1 Tax=Nonlabens xiamenensis TaxID=2341043 RepID=UPI001F0BA510|nr:hypothetical protein [Nonlabens xiamenensis]
MLKNLLLAILCITCLSSCYTSQGLASNLQADPAKFDPNTLTGLYENQIPDDDYNSLWNDLCLHFPDQKTTADYGDLVYLEYIDDKHVKAELYDGVKLLQEITLPGRRTENFFTLRKGSSFFSLIFISSFKSRKSILGNHPNGDLLLAQGKSDDMILLDDTDRLGEDGEIITATYMRLGDNRPVSQ